MASPQLLQDKFDGGFKRDPSPDQLPKNALYDVVNFLPNMGAPLRKRGGWSYEGVALDTLDAAATVPKVVFWAPLGSFGVDAQLLAWDNNGKLFDLTNGVDVGDTTVPLHTPVIFRNIVIWGSGGAAPKKYTGAAITDLGGSPPTNARICTVWRERVLFSGSTGSATTVASVYFSAPGNAESWDTTNATFQTKAEINGLAALPNCLLVFHPGSVTKVIGETIPSATNVGTLSQQTLFNNVGLFEPNAVAVQDEAAYWADENGVYKSDGVSLVDLTDKGGIKTYWQDLVATSDPDTIAVGVWRGYVFVSMMVSDTEIDFLLCDIEKKAWFRFTNIEARNFSVRYGAVDELYFSNRQTKFVGKLSTCFAPAAAVKNDADAEAVFPRFTTGYFRVQGQGSKRLRFIYLGYDMRDAASDNPTIAISLARNPDNVADNTTTPNLAETTKYERKRVRVQGASGAPNTMSGFMIGVGQSSGASSETKIYSLEAGVSMREGSRR